MEPGTIRVLLVEDDEDHYVLVADLLADVAGERRYDLDWERHAAAALEAIVGRGHDVCLLDYRLGAIDGLELLRAAVAQGCRRPIIMLTAMGDPRVDAEAMRAGAADYIEKGLLTASLLDRSIRYAIQHARALNELRWERDFIARTFDTTAALFLVLDREGRVVRFNGTCERTTGYTLEEVAGRPYWDAILPDELADIARTHYGELFESAQPAQRESVLRHKDGSRRLVSWSTSTMRDSAGQPEYLIGIGIDVTGQREAEEARMRLSAAVEQAGEAIAVVGPDGVIQYANPAFCRMASGDGEDVLGHSLGDLWGHSGAAVSRDEIERVMRTGSVAAFRVTLSRSDGGMCHLETTMSPIRNVSGRIVELAVVQRDVTLELSLEAQLRQAQKMEAIGRLAGGIAHDFNNLLTGILGHATMLRLHSSEGDPIHRAAEVIERAADGGADLTRQLLGFARQDKADSIAVDMHAVIEQVVSLLGRTLHKSIATRCCLDATAPQVIGDPTQLQQILVNLAMNAADAMPDGGELTLTTSLAQITESDMRLGSEMAEGEHLVVSVSDTGMGIDPDDLDKVFEPFFTRKETGTGMGLAMVYGIARNHGGTVHVHSERGVGTTFTVYLPRPTGVDDAPVVAGRSEPIRGHGRILLVDDEEAVREVAAEMLTHLGYDVTIACAGGEAVGIYSREGHTIDLVVIDLVMPDMGGGDCFRALREIDPSASCILASGYSLNGTSQELLDAGMKGFVQKPFDLVELSVAVALAVDAKLDGGASTETRDA